MAKTKEVILGVTGSIAAYKACEIINHLKKRKINVTVAMTEEAQHFITPLTLQALSANKVICDLFVLAENTYPAISTDEETLRTQLACCAGAGRSRKDGVNPAHISLAQRCDLVLIAPATANIIAKLASGLADDVLTCLALSTSAPIVLCCAMNEKMFKHKITQENIARLKKIGCRFVGPKKGHLVCGGEGIGHLASVEEIVQEVTKILKK